MALAGVLVGSIALALSVFASAVAGYQLQRFWRFRRPVFRIEAVEVTITQHARAYVLGPGDIVINARGPTRAVSLHRYELSYPLADGRAAGGYLTGSPLFSTVATGTGVTQVPYVAELEAEKWTRMQFRLDKVGLPLSKEAEQPPASYELTLILESPEELFIVPLPLRLSSDGGKYLLDEGSVLTDRYRRILRRRRTSWLVAPIESIIRSLQRSRPG